MEPSETLKHLAVAVLFVVAIMVNGTTYLHGANAVVIPPSQGYVVFTKETWGCIGEQKIVEEVTTALMNRDGNTVLIEEIKAHEDVQNRRELYVYFPAKEVNGLEGYYILRAHTQHPDPKIIGEWMVDQARLTHNSAGWFIELFSKTTGSLQISLLYSRHTGLSSGFIACPEADQFEPRAKSFIRAYRIESLLAVTSEPLDGGWTTTVVPMQAGLLQEARDIDRCEDLLEQLEKRFLSAGNVPFVWEKVRVTKYEVDSVVAGIEKETGRQYKISIELQEKTQKTELGRDKRIFVPKIRQKIVLKDQKGVLAAGEVWIGTTSDFH